MKKIFKKARDAAVEIDDTLPEIRDTWCVVRDGVWAYVRTTAIITAGIMALGAVLGLGGMGYALLNNAHADTIFGDVADCSQHRRCGYMKPVYRATADAGPEFTGEWEGATAEGHNPRISCPPGLVQYHVMSGDGPDRDYTCWNINAPPSRDGPGVRPCYGSDGQPCGGIADQWNGQWYGTWYPGWPPPFCPPHLSLYDAGGNPPGRRVFGCR